MNDAMPPENRDEPAAQGSLADRVILVTGMSGAGRTTALKVLEDLGSEAVDNLPLRLMATLVGQGPAAGRSGKSRAAKRSRSAMQATHSSSPAP